MLGNEGKIGLIWTLDKICSWNCAHCCVDAFAVERKGQELSIISNGFTVQEPLVGSGSIYQQAQRLLVQRGFALSLEEKQAVLRSLKGMDIEIGFSGGDLLLNPENLEVVKMASKMIGRSNVGLTATGVGMRVGEIEKYLDHVAQLEFTYDCPEPNDENHRQPGYNRSNYQVMKGVIEACNIRNVVTQALVPISNTNKNPRVVERLYTDLTEIGVQQVYLMRTLPVGRALNLGINPLGAGEYRRVIDTFFELAAQKSGPRVNIMCALKSLYPEKYPSNFCSVLKTTVDITANGRVILDAFAYGPGGEELFPEAIVGDLRCERLRDIITRLETEPMVKRVDENLGHCKVAAYLASQKSNSLDRLFDTSDPLCS